MQLVLCTLHSHPSAQTRRAGEPLKYFGAMREQIEKQRLR